MQNQPDPTGSVQPEVPSSRHPQPAVGASSQAPAPRGIWERLKQHKVAQWTLAYAAAGYTLLHAVEMLSEAQEWPRVIARVLSLVLILGVPVVITLAWYHGARHAHRVSGPELTIITILLVLTGSVLWALTRTGAHAPVQLRELAAPAASVAVVPFVNLTGDPGKEYFSDGMAEELINVLAQVPGLKVPSRTSSFAYKGRNVDIRRIAQDLGVTTILEGSVRSAGQQIRVTAQLVNAQTGYHLWSKDYDRQFTDIFKLQDELAATIVQALRTNLNAELPATAARAVPTQDVEAYRLYLQANGVASEGSPEKAIALLDQALMRDPKFAQALAFRAEQRLDLIFAGYPLHPSLEDAEREAQEALALSPNLARAHGILGGVNLIRGHWVQAEANFRAGIAADPNDLDTRAAHAIVVLQPAGRLRDAYADLIQGYREAPADKNMAWLVAQANSGLGHDEGAIKFADLATELGERRPILAPIYHDVAVRRRDYSEAAALAPELMPTAIRSAGDIAALKLFYAALADPAQTPAARQALESLTRKLESGDNAWPARMIYFFTMLGALDAAYGIANQVQDWFARETRVVDWRIVWIPEMRPFRKDARFQAFVTRMGLIDYWKQYGPPDDCDLKDGKLACR